MSGNTTISTSESRIEALALQSSAYGVTIPVIYGVNRISGNLIWYGDFKAIPHTTSQSSGGKGGGGVNQVSTTYTYSASVIMGLCEGEAIGVSQIWKAKKLYSGGVTSTQVLNATESYAIPGIGGTYTATHAAAFAAKGTVSIHHSTGGGKNGWSPYDEYLTEDTDFTVVRGVYVFNTNYAGQTVVIAYQYTSGGASQTSLQQLALSLATGAVGQSTWTYLNTFTPTGGTAGAQALGYSGIAYVYAQDYNLGSNGTVDNHSFEVQGTQAYSIGSSIPDANPALITFDLLTSTRYGAGYSKGGVYDLADWSSYCLASGLVLSPALEKQIKASDFISQICAVTNTAPVWSGGKLKFIPYGDTALTGNGVTFTPNVTPVYDLTDNDFIPSTGSDPVRVTRKPQSDAYNHIRVEFLNRANYYNVEIAEAKDSAAIDAFGLRSASVLQCHWICTAPIAQAVAQLLLQRSVYIRNTYAFNLPWTRAMLEPMDLVTLTDSGLGYNKLTVRITEVTETDTGDLAIAAEDFPAGVAHAATYPTQVSAGFQHNYTVAPGSVSAPMMWEAPIQLASTGLEIYAAVTGAGAYWGGCRVWVSLDGVTYKESSVLYGPSRYGTITNAVVGDNLPVQIGAGQLISGSAADAANLATLCYIGGANPEYFAYTSAALTGVGAYTLTGLNRNAYGSNPSNSAHVAGAPFVRIDKAIAKSGALDPAMVGKTVYLKFTSFNIYNAAEESLASVTAYPYNVAGTKPSALTGLTALGGMFEVVLDWTFLATQVTRDFIEIWGNTSNNRATGVLLSSVKNPTTEWNHIGLTPGQTWYYWARVVDTAGSYSDFFPLSSTAGIAATPSTDPSALLTQLTNSLGLAQLSADLAAPIGTMGGADRSNAIAALQSALSDYDLTSRMMWQERVTDATITVDPVTGKIMLLATANVTTDVSSRLTAVEVLANATSATLTSTVSTLTTVQGNLTSTMSAVTILQGQITTTASTVYVDNSVAQATGIVGTSANAYTKLAAAELQSAIDAFTTGQATNTLTASVAIATNNIKTTAEALAAQSANFAALVSTVTGSLASITTEQLTRASADTALASSITSISARLDSGDYAAVKVSASTSATAVGVLNANYVVKVDTNGHVAGYTVASGGATTSFTMLADKFAWVMETSPGSGVFTAPKNVMALGMVNGVATLGIDGSLVVDGSINARSITANTITTDKIFVGAATVSTETSTSATYYYPLATDTVVGIDKPGLMSLVSSGSRVGYTASICVSINADAATTAVVASIGFQLKIDTTYSAFQSVSVVPVYSLGGTTRRFTVSLPQSMVAVLAAGSHSYGFFVSCALSTASGAIVAFGAGASITMGYTLTATENKV
jgi:hypothetical protein